MSRRVLAIVIVIAATTGMASAERVRGTVVHAGTPVPDATVSSEHGDIVITAADGTFALEVPVGAPMLTVIAPGLAPRTVKAEASLVVELDDAGGGDVIEVVGSVPPPREPTSYRMTADEIRRMPGAAGDVLRATQVLPGVARIPFGLGGLSLRGTSPRDSAVYLDGIEVPLAFHFGGVTSFYPGAMLDDLAVLASGFDASFGRAGGGVVALSTRDPRRDRWRVGAELGLFDSGVSAEGPLPKHGGIIVGVRRSYLDAVAGPFLPDYTLPSYWDFQLRTVWGDRERITPMIFGSIDRMAGPGDSLTAAFVRAAVPYRKRTAHTTVSIVPWAGWSSVGLERVVVFADPQHYASPSEQLGLRADVARQLGWAEVRLGTELGHTWQSHEASGFTEPTGPMLPDGSSKQRWFDAAAWLDAKLEPASDRVLIRPGIRVERYGLSDEVVADPRLAIEEHLGGGIALRQTLGRFHQPPTAAEVDPMAGNPALDSSYFDQAAVGIDAELAGALLSATGFASSGHGLAVGDDAGLATLVDFELGSFGPTLDLLLDKQLGLPTHRTGTGRAHAHGLELAARRSSARWSGLVAYTLARSERRDDPSDRWRPFELDERHKLDAVGSVSLRSWQLGARMTVVSGIPYVPTVQAPPDPRLPAFVALDVRVARRWVRKWGSIDAFIDVHNATNRTNVEGRYYDELLHAEVDRKGLPLLPFVGVELVPPT